MWLKYWQRRCGPRADGRVYGQGLPNREYTGYNLIVLDHHMDCRGAARIFFRRMEWLFFRQLSQVKWSGIFTSSPRDAITVCRREGMWDDSLTFPATVSSIPESVGCLAGWLTK